MYVNLDNPAFNANRQYAFLRKYGQEMLIIVSNFDEFDVSVGIRIPQHAFDVMKIPQGEWKCTDLLSKETLLYNISPDSLFTTSIKAHGAVIWKVVFDEDKE